MTKLFLDFETRSRSPLKVVGADVYAEDASTEVILCGWALDDEEVTVWEPLSESIPGRLLSAVKDKDVMVYAWNARFERLVQGAMSLPMERLGAMSIPLERWYCIAVQARSCNLPGGLADASFVMSATGGTQEKLSGTALIRRFSKVNGRGEFNTPADYPEEWAKFKEYCAMDVEAARDIYKATRELADWELAEYHASEQVNDTGLLIDTVFCAGAEELIDVAERDAIARLNTLTKGEVTKVRGEGFKAWVYDRLSQVAPRAARVMEQDDKLTLDKFVRGLLLAREDVSGVVREALELNESIQHAAVKKYGAMKHRASPIDSRARGAYMHYGAHTGRFSARGIQLHNLPRESYDEQNTEMVIEACRRADNAALSELSTGSPLDTLKGLVRRTIHSGDRQFICADWSQIEGRVAPWLAQGLGGAFDLACLDKLAAYTDPGRDVYCETASAILGRSVGRDNNERQSHGKVPELALTYGGNVGALESMARAYNVQVDNPELIINNWRQVNAWAGAWHKAVKAAAVQAIRAPGAMVPVGRVAYQFVPGYIGGTLLCHLPSGRLLHYPFAELTQGKFGVEIEALWSRSRPKRGATGWPKIRLWHGILCENITQAVAACLLRVMIRGLVENGVRVVGHTHDEILTEVNNDPDTIALMERYLNDTLCQSASWWQGLPLAVETWTGTHYRK